MKKETSVSSKKHNAFLANFKKAHNEPRPNQFIVLDEMQKEDKLIVQAPTGTGKTALGYAFLKTHCSNGENGFYTCPSKTLVDQVVKLCPEVMAMYGRNEYPCLYYNGEHTADQVPCSLLKTCPHRVSLETGETYEHGAKPCPYFLAKYNSRQSNLVACTNQYYFFEALSIEELPHALVIDEVHKWADSIRSMMEYQISDYTLEEFWALLTEIGCTSQAKVIRQFTDAMIVIIRKSTAGVATNLIIDDDLRALLKIILKIQNADLNEKIKKAIAHGKIKPKEDRELLNKLDEFTGALYRYVRSLEFAIESKNRRAISYVFGFWNKKLEEGKRAQYILTVRSYMIAGLTRTKLLPKKHLAMSATIGEDAAILEQETGIAGKFIDLESDFPITNTAIFMPNDVPDLSIKGMSKNDKNRTMRKMLRMVKKGSENGIRSLIIVISEEERQKCIAFAKEESVFAVSYDTETKPREAIAKFKSGIGEVLIGTESQYGEGIDLPGDIAGFTFYLRPGYPSPTDPQAQFEEKRFGNRRWALWTWRVITKMLQARGRTIRSTTDTGCIFLMSQQFKRFTFAGLPKWLKDAYVRDLNLEDAVTKAIEVVKK